MKDLSSQFTEALTFATELHAQQKRKTSGIPYIAHLLGVASLVLEYGGNEDEAIAALLHDAIEDQGGAETRVEIRGCFGENVTAIVDGCTESDLEHLLPWRSRKEAYIDNITNASASVRLVAAADKIYNLRSLIKDYRLLGEQIWQYFHGGKDGTLWYYQALIKAFSQAEVTPIVEELIRVTRELEELVN